MRFDRLMLACAAAALIGCQTARVDEPLTAKVGGSGDEQQMEFWHRLNDQPVACYDDAFHALLLFADGKDDAADFPARLAALRDRGWLDESFNGRAEEAATRGAVATLLARALDIKGGVTMRLLGPVDRYALRELQAIGLYPPSSPNQHFTGAQLVAVIGRAEDYQRRKNPAP
jgi:hypothetical protein